MLPFFGLFAVGVFSRHFFVCNFLVFFNPVSLKCFSCVNLIPSIDFEFLNMFWFYLFDPQTNVFIITNVCKRLLARIHNISKKIKENCEDILIRICEELFTRIHNVLIKRIKEGDLDILIGICKELFTRIHKISIKIKECVDILIRICKKFFTRIHKILIKVREVCTANNLISICKELLHKISIMIRKGIEIFEELLIRIHNISIMIRQSCVYIAHFYYQLWFCVQLFLFFRINSYYTSFELFYSLLVYTMVDIEMRLLDDLILESIWLVKIYISHVLFPADAVIQLPPTFYGPPLIEVGHTDPELRDFKVVHTTPGEKFLLLGVLVVGLVLGFTLFTITDKYLFLSYKRDGEIS